MLVKFTYNEPRFGDMEVTGTVERWTDEEIIAEVEKCFPEAIDIEVLEIVSD